MGIKPRWIKLFVHCVLFISGYRAECRTVDGLNSKHSFPSVQETRETTILADVSLVTAPPLAQMAFSQFPAQGGTVGS